MPRMLIYQPLGGPRPNRSIIDHCYNFQLFKPHNRVFQGIGRVFIVLQHATASYIRSRVACAERTRFSVPLRVPTLS